MTKIDYDIISKIYDDVRDGELQTIKHLLDEINITSDTTILDIGCGTGNYTNLIARAAGCKVYGLDPSKGMLSKAREKNSSIAFVQGDACCIPFNDNYFDLVYMTDVIHHIPDIDKMFDEIYRILKSGGRACIITQSHRQIDSRFMTEFFPSTAAADKQRYPDIDKIIHSGSESGLDFYSQYTAGDGDEVKLGEQYIELLEKKGYSMLHLIPEEEYRSGLDIVKAAMSGGNINRKSAGYTFVWFKKQAGAPD